QPISASTGHAEGSIVAIMSAIVVLPARPVVSVTVGATAEIGVAKRISAVHQVSRAPANRASAAKMYLSVLPTSASAAPTARTARLSGASSAMASAPATRIGSPASALVTVSQ